MLLAMTGEKTLLAMTGNRADTSRGPVAGSGGLWNNREYLKYLNGLPL